LENGKIINLSIKKNAFWSDGQKLTIDDIIFTIEKIQDPEIKSFLFPLWTGVKTTKISDEILQFQLKNPSPFFFENLTFKILPKHFFKKISSLQSFYSTNIFFSPTAGPFKIKNFEQSKDGKIKRVELERNEKYFGPKPYLKKIIFYFYPSKEKLIFAFKNGQIDAFSFSFDPLNDKKIKKYYFSLPRYFAVFFNLKKELFAQKSVREIISLAVDRREILKEVLNNQGRIFYSPFLPEFFGLKNPKEKFSESGAKEIIEKEGFQEKDGLLTKNFVVQKGVFLTDNLALGSVGNQVKGLQSCLLELGFFKGEINGIFDRKLNEAVVSFQEFYSEEILKPSNLTKGNGQVREATRKKLNELCFQREEKSISLKFKLTTLQEPILLKTAEVLKRQWEKFGIKVEIENKESDDFKQIVSQKDYDALLIGQSYRSLLDPYPFWHSSQIEELGLNLSRFEKKEADRLIEEIRQTKDPEILKEKLNQLQEMVLEEKPLIVLFSPYYFYFAKEKLKGVSEGTLISPFERMNTLSNYYFKEKRVFDQEKIKKIKSDLISFLRRLIEKK
ncbi:MAG: ABC transporter substrate-binding protein, partial [Minisyncoccales bacterium]